MLGKGTLVFNPGAAEFLTSCASRRGCSEKNGAQSSRQELHKTCSARQFSAGTPCTSGPGCGGAGSSPLPPARLPRSAARTGAAIFQVKKMSYWFIKLIKAYQYLISPWLRPSCRFSPTCSDYACQALGKYGALKGIWLSSKRISRCHPWHDGGYDPLP